MEDTSNKSPDVEEKPLGGENPLLVNSVLETLFSFLNVEELKSCRYVCKQWRIEAFRTLRKLTCVDLNSSSKQRNFLQSNEATSFNKFSFKLCEWNRVISSYLKSVTPNRIEVEIKIFLSKEYKGNCVENFDDLLRTQCTRLSKLAIYVDSQGTLRLTIPGSLLLLEYPQLKQLVIINDQIDAAWLHPLWISIIGNSPQLETIELHNISDTKLAEDIWNSPRFPHLKELRYTHNHKGQNLRMHEQLTQSKLPQNLRRLQISFQETSEAVIKNLLQKVAATLEMLEFHTKDESALSPIDFPSMPKLLVLDAGNSQFSFPSITPDKFPKLAEIKATYWDWVYTFEELPDVHYYWGTADAHRGITSIHLRFPNWSITNLQYARLENFEDFVGVLNTKFPNACDFTIHNVPVSDDIRRTLEKFVEVYEFNMRSFRIATYCSFEIVAANPFEISVDESSTQNRELAVLDLGSKTWPDIWRDHQALLGDMRNEWLSNLLHFDQLRVLKLLWANKLLSTLGLTNLAILPKLEHLEFVGNKCVSRFERAAVRRARPTLCLIQWKTCYCADEDWWYMTDPESGEIFSNLFSLKGPRYPIPKILKEAFTLIGLKVGK